MGTFIVPSVGLFRSEDHQYWRDGVGPVPGVTTVQREYAKPQIIEWAKRETARCAIDNRAFLDELIAKGGEAAAIAWLAQIPDFIRDEAGKIGNAVHRYSEDISRGREVEIAIEHLPFVQGYRNFLEDYQPEFKSYERYVWSDKGYAGTFDWIARINGQTVLGDTKTSRAVYPEVAFQLAALAFADHIGMPNEAKRWPMPKIQRFAVLHVRPEQYVRGYRLIDVRVTEADYAVFLSLLEAFKWRKEREKAVLGESIPRPVVEAVA